MATFKAICGAAGWAGLTFIAAACGLRYMGVATSPPYVWAAIVGLLIGISKLPN